MPPTRGSEAEPHVKSPLLWSSTGAVAAVQGIPWIARNTEQEEDEVLFLEDTESFATMLLKTAASVTASTATPPAANRPTTRTPISPGKKEKKKTAQQTDYLPHCRDIWMDGSPENDDAYVMTELRQVIQTPDFSRHANCFYTEYDTLPPRLRPLKQCIMVHQMILNVPALKELLLNVSFEDVWFNGCPMCLREQNLLFSSGHFDACALSDDAPLERVQWLERSLSASRLESCQEYHDLKATARDQCEDLLKIDVPFSYIDAKKKKRAAKVTCSGKILDALLGLDELVMSQSDFWKMLRPLKGDDTPDKDVQERYFIWLVHRLSRSQVKMWMLMHEIETSLLSDGFYGTVVSIEERSFEALKMERVYTAHKAGDMVTYFRSI